MRKLLLAVTLALVSAFAAAQQSGYGSVYNAPFGINDSAGTITYTIASGATALATSSIASATCNTAATGVTATGVVATDAISASFNADPTGVTGYTPSALGMLTILSYPTAGAVNFKVCNNTASSITPGAITINWRVVR